MQNKHLQYYTMMRKTNPFKLYRLHSTLMQRYFCYNYKSQANLQCSNFIRVLGDPVTELESNVDEKNTSSENSFSLEQ